MLKIFLIKSKIVLKIVGKTFIDIIVCAFVAYSDKIVEEFNVYHKTYYLFKGNSFIRYEVSLELQLLSTLASNLFHEIPFIYLKLN